MIIWSLKGDIYLFIFKCLWLLNNLWYLKYIYHKYDLFQGTHKPNHVGSHAGVSVWRSSKLDDPGKNVLHQKYVVIVLHQKPIVIVIANSPADVREAHFQLYKHYALTFHRVHHWGLILAQKIFKKRKRINICLVLIISFRLSVRLTLVN